MNYLPSERGLLGPDVLLGLDLDEAPIGSLGIPIVDPVDVASVVVDIGPLSLSERRQLLKEQEREDYISERLNPRRVRGPGRKRRSMWAPIMTRHDRLRLFLRMSEAA